MFSVEHVVVVCVEEVVRLRLEDKMSGRHAIHATPTSVSDDEARILSDAQAVEDGLLLHRRKVGNVLPIRVVERRRLGRYSRTRWSRMVEISTADSQSVKLDDCPRFRWLCRTELHAQARCMATTAHRICTRAHVSRRIPSKPVDDLEFVLNMLVEELEEFVAEWVASCHDALKNTYRPKGEQSNRVALNPQELRPTIS